MNKKTLSIDEQRRKDEYINLLKEKIKENSDMVFNGNLNTAIYMIENIVVGGYEQGVRSVDHNALLTDDINWQDIINWGTIIVPENKNYISDTNIDSLEEIGFSAVPTTSNHIVGFDDSITLYHGSMNLFDQFNFDNLEKNGTAQGVGIYLSPNKELAEMYSERNNVPGYIYTVEAKLENQLALDNLTLSRETVSSIIDKFQENEKMDILSHFGDVNYEGYSRVKNSALDLLMDNENDVDIYNEFIHMTGYPKETAEVFYEIGNYTHILAKEQTRLASDVFIVLNPDNCKILEVENLNERNKVNTVSYDFEKIKSELTEILGKYDYSLLIFDEELEEMLNEKDIESLLPINSPKELREEIENLLSNSLSEKITFGFTTSDNENELQAYLLPDEKKYIYTANDVIYSSGDFSEWSINDEIINDIRIDPETHEELMDDIIQDIVFEFNKLSILETEIGYTVVNAFENTVWFEHGSYSIDDPNLETYLLEALEEYPNSTGTLNDLINLIKEHKLEDRTNIQEVLKVYLSNATEYKDINDFSRDLFSSLGANIDTPIAGVSFDENTRTSTITLDDELSDEDYEAIIRFNLSPADSLTMTAAGIKLLKDNNEIVADNLKTIYEEQGFKELLLNDFQLLGLTQLQHSSLFKSNPDLFHKLVDSDPAYTKAFIEANKEKDLDVDGIPDRIDIDDTRNSVQTVSNLSLVENQTSKNEEVKSTPKRGMSK